MSNLQKFLNVMYDDNSFLFLKRFYWEEPTFIKIDQVEKELEQYNQYPTETGMVIPINPLYSDGTPKLRNFLFEMDREDLSIDQQLSLMTMPCSAVLFTGGKSVHVLLCLEDGLGVKAEYKKLWQRIAYAAQNGDLDPQTGKPGITTKIPGGLRLKNGEIKEQTLIAVTRKFKLEEIERWLSTKPQLPPPAERKVNKNYYSKFESMMMQYAPEDGYHDCPACGSADKLGVTYTSDAVLTYCFKGCTYSDIKESLTSLGYEPNKVKKHQQEEKPTEDAQYREWH